MNFNQLDNEFVRATKLNSISGSVSEHLSDSAIHFKQADISINSNQISNFSSAVSAVSDVVLNTAHRTSNGTDHSYINQDVKTTATPAFVKVITPEISTSGDLTITCGTDKTIVMAESVWVDIDFPIIIRTTGSNIPSLVAMIGNIQAPQWAVNDYNVCEGQELIHSWKEETEVYWHLHLVTNGLDVNNRYVRFEVEYTWANVNSALASVVTIDSGDILIPANTADKTMRIASLGSFTPSSGKIGGHIWARLKRITSIGTAPTHNPWITMLQLHIECDTIGSRAIGTK